MRGLIAANRKLVAAKQMVADAEKESANRLTALIEWDAENGVETLKDTTTYVPRPDNGN